MAGGFAASAAENERAALDFALEEHAGQRMLAAEILRADADEQRAVCVYAVAARTQLMPLVTTLSGSLAAATTVPPGHMQKV